MRTLSLKSAVLPITVALLSGMDAVGGQETMSLEKSGIIENIQSMPRTKVNSIQPDGTPVQIQAASAREISKGVFRRLTGEAAGHRSMSTYPDITLVNISGRTITSFMILVKSRADNTNSGHAVLTKDLSIVPGASYSLASSKWTKAEKIFVEKNGKFISALRQPGLDSPKSWLPGVASDLTVVIGMVVFEDGSQWRVPAGFAW